jgi:hypothetical protein
MGTSTLQDRLDNSRSLAIHWFAASRLRRRRHLAIGDRLGLTSGDPRQYRRNGPGREPDEPSKWPPKPGHLTSRRARRRRRPGERSDGERSGPEHPGEPVDDRE